jgi:hypothetical protein
MQGRIGSEFINRVVELPQHLGAVAIEARTFGRQLQNACRPRKKRDTEILFQALNRPADRRCIDQQASRSRHKASTLDNPDEDIDSAHIRWHIDLNPDRRIVDNFSLLSCGF